MASSSKRLEIVQLSFEVGPQSPTAIIDKEFSRIDKIFKNFKGFDTIKNQTAGLDKEFQGASKEAENLGKHVKNVDSGNKIPDITQDTRRLGDQVKNTTSSSGVSFDGLWKQVAKGQFAFEAVRKAGQLVGSGLRSMARIGANVVGQFGELEQNIGGSEAVFESYATNLQKLGEDAYKTMGTSQSQYLATANIMGSLFQGSGLSIERSASLTADALQRAADVASIMGIDVQVALDSVAGAAKGNFTMMDNLGVAMNATTLQAYALEKGVNFKWNTATNAQKAELAMQMFFDRTSQYAGNFERESTETVTGALGLLVAAGQSFVAGLGNADADMQNLTENMIDAFRAVVKNVVPILGNLVRAIPKALGGILDAMDEILPMVIEAGTGLFTQLAETFFTVLPEVLPALVDALGTVFNEIVNILSTNRGALLDAGKQILLSLFSGAEQSIPTILGLLRDTLMDIFAAIVEVLPQAAQSAGNIGAGILEFLQESITNDLPMLLNTGVSILQSIVQGVASAIPVIIPQAVQFVVDAFMNLIQYAPTFLQMGLQIIVSLAQGLMNGIIVLIQNAPLIVQSILNTISQMLPMILQAGMALALNLINGLVQAIPLIAQAIPQIIQSIVSFIAQNLPMIIQTGMQILVALATGLIEAIPLLIESIPQIVSGIWDALKSVDWLQLGKDILSAIWNGIVSIGTSFKDMIVGLFDGKDAGEEVGKDISAGIQENVDVNVPGSAISSMPEITMPEIKMPELDTSGMMNFAATSETTASDVMGNLSTMSADTDALMASFGDTVSLTGQTAAQDFTNMTVVMDESIKGVDLQSDGERVIQSLIDGMRNKEAELINQSKKIGNIIAQGTRNALDMHSPSRIGLEIGENWDDSLARGQERRANDLQARSRETAMAIPTGTAQAATVDQSSRVEGDYAPSIVININGYGSESTDIAQAVQVGIAQAFRRAGSSLNATEG